MAYKVGDIVFWATASTVGNTPLSATRRATKRAKVLVLAHSGEISVEIDADECSPTSRSNPQHGRGYRQRYFRNRPGGLEGNP